MDKAQNERNYIPIYRSTIILTLGTVALVLVLLSIGGMLVLRPNYPDYVQSMVSFFNSANEGNFPTYFSSFLLMFSALLLLIITIAEKNRNTPYVSRWAILTIGLMSMSLDEMLVLHEKVSLLIRTMTNWSGQGFFRSPWVILGILTVIIFFLILFRFFIQLDPKTRLNFLIAATLYIGSAIGFEIIENIYGESHGQDLIYKMMQNVEEGMEMAAIIVFISGLLDYISDNFKSVKFQFFP